ncbi:MAG TPA: SH3 domain-containing protein, partial [Thermomicrobiales bacterium]|nr:SH3 domain-containing protein [Thermomicrobiales bacterium]
GLCWVQIVSEETGKCAVAPVLDRGPLFVRDDWWNLQRHRVYPLKRGLPAAEVAAAGRNLGFGRGISDSGHDVAGVFTYAAAIDLGAGTFVDLGLDPGQGIGEVRVKLLWQAGALHLDACGADYGNGQTSDDVNLRDGPSTNDDVITVLPPNRRLSITGATQNGFYLVDADGMRGWVHSAYLRPDGGSVGDPVGFITDAVNFRTGPSTADDIHQVVPTGSVVVVTGRARNNFVPVRFDGKSGWISKAYVDLGDASPGGGSNDGNRGTAETTDYVNFRTGPGLDRSVIRVLPPGTAVQLNGAEEHGFYSVTHHGRKGWIHRDYLSTDGGSENDTMLVLDDLNLRDGPSTADGVILVMPPGAVVTVIGSIDNGFYPVRYREDEGWAHYKYLK